MVHTELRKETISSVVSEYKHQKSTFNNIKSFR